MNDLASIVQQLESDIEQSLDWLSKRLTVSAETCTSHCILTVTGLDHSPECLRNLAVYCVGQIAKAVQVNLEIRADLLGLDNASVYDTLAADIQSVIGKDNSAFTDKQKTDERDPWVVEALSHLFIQLAMKNPGFLPVGQLIALTQTHRSVKEPGLDLVLAYSHGTVGLGIGESKALENAPSTGLNAAVTKFSEVDQGAYDSELRTIVQLMRYAMLVEYQNQMTGAFWRQERAYFPFISYSSLHHPQWNVEKESLLTLGIPATHNIVTPLPIEDFRGFFDDLSDAMRSYLESLEAIKVCTTPLPTA